MSCWTRKVGTKTSVVKTTEINHQDYLLVSLGPSLTTHGFPSIFNRKPETKKSVWDLFVIGKPTIAWGVYLRDFFDISHPLKELASFRVYEEAEAFYTQQLAEARLIELLEKD